MRIESVSLASYTPEGSDPLCPNPNFGDTLHLHDIPAWVVVYKAPYAFDARVGGYVQPGAVTIPPNLSTRIVEIVSAENGAHIVGFELP